MKNNINAPANTDSATFGMTDAELEQACEPQPAGVTPWAHWTSEIYSFGKCLRFWTRYPDYLPLFVYSDHGVGLHSHLFRHELENPARVHFTWNPMKVQRHQNLEGKEVIQIINPWISYRRIRKIERSENHRGTLVFFMHGTNAVKWSGHDSEDYFEKLRELPDRFQPVVLCLHMHDIKAGLHKKLRKHGFPIVTAGNTLSTHFVDRFYDLVRHYSYATAQAWGSYAGYCVELGIPYFHLGARPELINLSDPNLPGGAAPRYWDSFHEECAKKAEALFELPVDNVTAGQREFVESMLGLGSQLSRRQVCRILWREFFRNWRKWHSIFTSLLKAFTHKFLQGLGLSGLARKIRQHLMPK